MSTSTGTKVVPETNSHAGAQDTTGEGVDLHKGIQAPTLLRSPDPDQEEALDAAAQVAAKEVKAQGEEPLAATREEDLKEKKWLEERLLPAEREELKFDGWCWVGNIRYERSSGQYLTFVCDENTESGVWVKAGVAEARRFLTNEGLRTKKEIECFEVFPLETTPPTTWR